MKGRLFTRVFDHHTFACYFAAIALMLFLVGGHRSPLLFVFFRPSLQAFFF